MSNVKIDNPKGPELKELRSRFRTDNEGVHYSDYMFSGPQILGMVVDVMTDMSERRDNGDPSMLVNTTCNYRAPLFAEETVEVIMKLDSEGKRSRTHTFEMYKLTKYFREDGDRFEILDEPVLVCDGTATCVVKKERA